MFGSCNRKGYAKPQTADMSTKSKYYKTYWAKIFKGAKKGEFWQLGGMSGGGGGHKLYMKYFKITFNST
jgi:hypothetical protein